MSGLLNSWLWWADRVCCRVARQPLHGVVHTACRWLPAMLYPFIFGPEAVQGTKMVEQVKRIGVPDIRAHKGGVPIVSLTAYTTPVARAFDAHVDLILVGDSVGMVLYGMSTTLPVTLEMMIAHGQAVMRGSRRACVMVDLPFGSYQESKEQAFRSASRVLVETGCAAVKLEGGVEMAETIRFLVQRGVPVCGHIGLMPQSVQVAGGFRATGRSADEAEKLRADARAVDEAGAFAVVLEGVVEPLAAAITADVSLPTIGIGASPQCDGQVLVADDVLGVFDDFTPRFAKRYAELGALMGPAAAAYAEEVRARRFPSLQHCFGVRKASIADASIKPVQTS